MVTLPQLPQLPKLTEKAKPTISTKLRETDFFKPTPELRFRDVFREAPGAVQKGARIIKSGLKAFDPRDFFTEPKREVRPLFARDAEPVRAPGIVAGATDITSRMIEEVFLSTAQTVTRNIPALAELFNIDLPRPDIDATRIRGFELATDEQGNLLSAGEEFFKGLRDVGYVREDGSRDPKKLPQAIGVALISPVSRMLDATIVGSLITVPMRSLLMKTGFKPMLEIRPSKLAYATPKEASQIVVRRAKEKAQEIITRNMDINTGKISTQGKRELNQLGQEVTDLGSIFRREGPFMDLNRLGNISEEVAISLTQPIGRVQAGLRSTPQITRAFDPATALPGFRPTSGQAPAFGLSIQKVERVGGKQLVGKAQQAKSSQALQQSLTPAETTALRQAGMTPEDAFNAVRVEREITPPSVRRLLDETPPTRITRQETTLLKDRLRNISRGAREGSIATREQIRQTQQELTDIVKAFLPAEEQGKFLTTIRNIQTPEQLQRAIPDIERRISTILDRRDIARLRNQIQKELKGIAPKRDKSGVLKSKFDPETQKKLDEIKRFSDMKVETAEERLVDLIELTQRAEDITPEMVNRMRMLRYSSKDLPPTELQNLLDDIKSVKDTGRTVAEAREFNKQTQIQRQAETLADAIRDVTDPSIQVFPPQNPTFDNVMLGQIRKKIDDYFNAQLAYEFIADKLTSPKKFPNVNEGPFVDHTTQHRRQVAQQLSGEALAYDELNKGMERAFGKSTNEIYPVLQSTRNVGTFKDAFGKNVKLEMTVDEIIYFNNLLKDPTLVPSFRESMGWTDEMITSVKKSLSPEEQRLGNFLIDEFYPRYFDGFDGVSISEVFERRFGTAFSPRRNYSPITREVDQPLYVEQFTDYVQQISTKPGQIKARINNKLPIKPRGATESAVKYINDMERFKHLSEYIDDSRKIFSNQTFKDAVVGSHKDGNRYLDLLNDTLDGIWRGQRKFEDRVMWLDTLRGYGASGLLGINPTQIPKQLTSIVASMNRVPLGQWSLNFADFFKNPIRNFKTLQDSSMLKARYKQANFSQELAQARKDGWLEKVSGKTPFRDKMLFMTRYGDLGGIVGAGWPIYRYEFNQALRKGLTKTEAHKRGIAAFEDNFSQTQTSARMGDIGRMQRGNSYMSLWTLFMNSPMQYNRFAMAALRKTVKGKTLTRQNVKTFYIFWSLLPTLFGLAAHPLDVPNLFNRDERGQRARKRVVLNQLAGGTQYPVIVGSMIYNVLRGAAGLQTFSFDTEPTPFTVISEVGRWSTRTINTIKDIAEKGDVTAEDVITAMQELQKAATLATGIPIDNTADLAKNWWEAFNGDLDNYLKLFGYGDWALDADLQPKLKEGLLPELPKLPQLPEMPSF